jgi:hypothetical protein
MHNLLAMEERSSYDKLRKDPDNTLERRVRKKEG